MGHEGRTLMSYAYVLCWAGPAGAYAFAMDLTHATSYLRVSNMETSLSFYRDCLGFEVVNESRAEDGLFWVSLRLGAATLMLSTRPSRIFEHQGLHKHDSHGRHIFPGPTSVNDGDLNQVTYLYVPDADAAYSELLSRGVMPMDKPENKFYGVREFLVRDPDGYYYAIAQVRG